MKGSLKSIINIIGSFFVLASLYYVWIKFTEYWSRVDEKLINSDFFIFYFIIILLNVFASFIQSNSWYFLIRFLKKDILYGRSVSIYGITQICKYLPGNVGHVLGRQFYAQKFLDSKKIIALSITLELVLQLVIGLILSLLFFFIFIKSKGLLYFLLALLLILMFFLYEYEKNFFMATFSILLYLSLNSLLFIVLWRYFEQNELNILEEVKLFSLYIFSWTLGFVFPGSPGGIGIRESTFLYFYKDLSTISSILPALLFIRLSNIVSDVLFFLISLCLGKIIQNNSKEQF